MLDLYNFKLQIRKKIKIKKSSDFCCLIYSFRIRNMKKDPQKINKKGTFSDFYFLNSTILN